MANSNMRNGFPESQLLRDSLTEAINRYENCTNITRAPDRQTFANPKEVNTQINERVQQIVSLDQAVASMPGYCDIVRELVIVSAYELNEKDLEDDDVKVPSIQTLGRFVQTCTPTPPPPPPKFKCSLCDKQFEKLWVVKRHMKDHASMLEQYILPVQ